MKQLKRRMIFVSLLVFLSIAAAPLFAQKMTPEDVLAKHLDSIGSAKSREAIKTRIIVSDVQFLLQSINPVAGKSVIASSTDGVIFGINLDAVNYRLDKFSYDGKKVRVGFLMPGKRSHLGDFIFAFEDVLKKGLLGGTLSSSWALLNADRQKARLTVEGTEKIDGKEAIVVGYTPKGGADVNVKLFFDRENYRHVRSEYNQVIGAGLGSSSADSMRQIETRYRVIEDFSNYKKFGDLNLPSSYKIVHTVIRGGAQPTKAEWKFKITDASFNQPLGAEAFDINAN